MRHTRRTSEGTRHEAAASWVVRLETADLTEAEAVAFDSWLSASPDNAAAYDQALAVSNAYASAATDIVRALAERRGARPVGRRALLAGGAMAAAAAVAVVLAPDFRPAPVAAYATGKGERSTLRLADGSTIDLNAGTRLTVSLGRESRNVKLAEGQAVFDVAPDPRRPFVIDAGDRTVRVVGTQFDVRRRGGKLSVTVARGLVEVRPAAGADGGAYRLRPGQRLDHVEGDSATRVAAAEPAEVLGWRSGRVVYRDQPLADVVTDLNQQFATPIRIDDPILAATPISGVLVLDDQDAVIRRLALLVPIRAVRSDAGVVLRRDVAPDRK